MALKDVLADKRKKRTLAILGTIVIIFVCAGVFWAEARLITTQEPPEEEAPEEEEEEKPVVEKEELLCQSDSGTATATTPGGPGPVLIIYYPSDIFTVSANETPKNATVKIEWVSGFGDLDLYVVDSEGNKIGSSTEAGFRNYEEVVELNAADLKTGAPGTWQMWVYYWAGVGPVTYRWSYAYYYLPAE